MSTTRRKINTKEYCNIRGEILTPTNEVEDLSITFQINLKIHNHYSYVANKAHTYILEFIIHTSEYVQ